MIAVSNDFKNAMQQPIKELDAYIKLNKSNVIRSADDLISFTISCESGMCKAAMRKLEAKYLGEHDLLGKWVNVGFGVRLSNGNFEYLDYGSFLVTKISYIKDTGVTTIIGYDKMINSMTKYTKIPTNYPISLYDYTKTLCSECNLELANENFKVHNDWQITGELWENIEGITYRDILLQIAQATASTCIIGNNNKVYFKYLNDTGEQLTYDNMKKLKLEPKYGEINSVVLSRTPQEDNIYFKDDDSIEKNGLTEYKIENNEIIDKFRNNAIIPIYNELHGISYYPFEITTEGLGWYEIADSFNILNDSGDVFNTSLFNFSITIDGGIKEILKSVAETKTQTQYQYATTMSKRVKNTEIIVNKQEQYIKQLVTDINEYDERIAEVEQSYDSIKNSVSIFSDLTRNKKSTNKLYIKNVNKGFPLKLSIKNASQVYPSMETYPDYNLFPVPEEIYLVIDKEVNLTENAKQIKLPITYLASKGEVFDEFIIEKTNMYIIRRIGFDNDGYKYVLDNEIKEDLGTINIELFEGDNYIYLYAFNDMGVIYEIDYLVKSDLTDIFATNVSVDSKIEQSATDINLGVGKKITDVNNEITELSAQVKINSESITSKVAKKDVVSTISQSAEEINIKGNRFVVEADNLKITKNGTVSSKNGEFTNCTINGGSLKLKNGATVTGDNGLVTNLVYIGYTRGNLITGSGDFIPLGHVGGGDNVNTQRNALMFTFKLPENFTVKSAKIHLVHTPISWQGIDSNNITGYSRNLKLYKLSSFNVILNPNYGYYASSSYGTEVKNAFGTNGFTGSTYTTNATSIDISSQISKTEVNQFAVMTSDGLQANNANIFGRTGGVIGYLEILGYMNFT